MYDTKLRGDPIAKIFVWEVFDGHNGHFVPEKKNVENTAISSVENPLEMHGNAFKVVLYFIWNKFKQAEKLLNWFYYHIMAINCNFVPEKAIICQFHYLIWGKPYQKAWKRLQSSPKFHMKQSWAGWAVITLILLSHYGH